MDTREYRLTARPSTRSTLPWSLLEFERHLILARTAEGRQRAQQRGVRFGRKRVIPGTTRAYVMNGLFVGTGLATIAGRLRERGYIVAYGSYRQDRAFAADACAHPADRIVVIGHSFGAEAAARVATQAAACGARDVTMIGVDPAAPSEVRGVSHAVNFVGEYRGTIGGAQNIPVPGYTHMSIMESPAVQQRILSEVSR